MPRGCLPEGGVCPGGVPPRGQTDTCENITFPQLLLRTVKIQPVIFIDKNGFYGNEWRCSYLEIFGPFIRLIGFYSLIQNKISPNFGNGLNFVTCEHALSSCNVLIHLEYLDLDVAQPHKKSTLNQSVFLNTCGFVTIKYDRMSS